MQSAPRRGRPTEVDRHEVALVALRLFEGRGFDGVSMDEIAEAAGASRRTLFRLFPSKADLVWDGVEQVLAAVRARASEVPAGVPLSTVVETLFGDALGVLEQPAMAEVARRRLRLIASSPQLMTHSLQAELQQTLEQALRGARLPAGVPKALVARTLFAVGFSALVWWAQTNEPRSPGKVLRAALRGAAAARRHPGPK